MADLFADMQAANAKRQFGQDLLDSAKADGDRLQQVGELLATEIARVAPAVLEIPARLPVPNLSHSSLSLLWKCPLKWKRRYIDHEYEPPSGAMIIGSCTGAAERINYEHKIQTGGIGLSEADVLDVFADEWRERSDRDDIDWKGEKPQNIRDSGQGALAVYHRLIAPSVRPTSVERKFQLRFPGAEWGFTGYLDLEEEDGSVGDLKCKSRRLAKTEADSDSQPTSYMLARRAEGNPADAFEFHTMIRTTKPVAEVIPTTRTDRQLDAFLQRILDAAAEIHWRATYDVWSGAMPGSWWCSRKFCGYFDSCPYGGLR